MKTELANIYKNEFADVIRARLGIHLNDSQTDVLIKAISSACEKFKCEPIDFLEMLKSERSNSAAFDYISTNITIGETYFFRDKKQMKILEETILPDIIQKRRQDKSYSIRIWSAGCSSGEEIYTIGMLLNELIHDKEKWKIFLLGTDINTRQLHKALKGVFGEWSMRAIPPYYKHKYFSSDDNQYHLSKKIKSMAEFSYLNLKDDIYPSILNNTNAHDLIMCRNVLIYFDDESIKNVMQRIGLCLVQNGYLMLGASDPISQGIKTLSRHEDCASLLIRLPIDRQIESKSHIDSSHIFKKIKETLEEPVTTLMVADKQIEKRKPTERKQKVIKKPMKSVVYLQNPLQLANEGKLQCSSTTNS